MAQMKKGDRHKKYLKDRVCVTWQLTENLIFQYAKIHSVLHILFYLVHNYYFHYFLKEETKTWKCSVVCQIPKIDEPGFETR